MPHPPRLHALFTVAFILLAQSATAAPSQQPFVAPGLWQIVSDVHGPMGQHTQLTQEQCWNAQGESNQGLVPLRGARVAGVTSDVSNTAHRSTVKVHSTLQMPGGGVTVQDATMVFTDAYNVLRRATMTGHGSMKSTSAVLDETFTQRGHWLSAVCPATLPPAQTRTLAAANIPALTALQNLAGQMKALDPHPNGP